MGYKVDYEPKQYLERRIIYYKKKKAAVKRLSADKGFLKEYGKRNWEQMCKERLQEIDALIENFKKAISKL